MKNLFFAAFLIGIITSCGTSKGSETEGGGSLMMVASKNFEAIYPSTTDKNDPKVKLGEALFFENALSLDNSISCNSCHDIKKFGVDNLAFSNGVKGSKTKRNSPTIFNVHLQSSQFWDGRAATLEEQIRMPMLADVEMAMPSEDFIVEKINRIESYKTSFEEIYPSQGLTMGTMSDAIAAYIKSLTIPSRFDDYLNGKEVLTEAEVSGLKLFLEKGCAECHGGQLLGDGFEEFGVFDNYWEHTSSQKIDSGRYLVTKDPDDLFVFKVPSLRNVNETHPYFHDGSVAKLDDAVRIMGKVQLDQELSSQEVSNIVSFLKTLTQSKNDINQ